MTALMFGEPDWPLFGRFYPVPAGARQRKLAILAPPFGEEGIRAHRTLSVLAERLAAEGCAVFRFDWFGTGDSSGDDAELAYDRAVESLHLAHDEALAMAGRTRATWIGLRLGASVADCAAPALAREIDKLVLWDPIWDVAAHRHALIAAHARFIERSVGGAPEPSEALGFPLADALLDPLAEDRLRLSSATPAKTLIIGEAPAATDAAVLADPEAEMWNSDRAMNAYVVPAQSIALILSEVMA